MQLLKDNMEENLSDGYDNEILNNKNVIHEKKPAKMNFIKIKNVYSAKDTIKRMKNKPQTRRKYLENISDKRLVSKI